MDLCRKAKCPANSVKFALYEGSKTVLSLDPRRSICRKSPGGKKKMRTVAGLSLLCDRRMWWQGFAPLGGGRAPSRHAQRNDVGPGGQSGGHFGGIASGDDQVVIFTGPKTTEHRGRLLRLDQRQVSQEGEDVLGWRQPRCDERDFDIFVMEVPSQGSRRRTACSYTAGCRTPGAGLSNTMRSLRSSSRLNSRTLSAPVRAGAFHSTWRGWRAG